MAYFSPFHHRPVTGHDEPPDTELPPSGSATGGIERVPSRLGPAEADALAARLDQARGSPQGDLLALDVLRAVADLVSDRALDECLRPRAGRLLDPAVVDAVTRLPIDRDARDLATDYAHLLRLLLRAGVLRRDATLAALTRQEASSGRPALLLQLVTTARWSIPRSEALAALVVELSLPGEIRRSEFRRVLLELKSPHSLPEDDKYAHFYGRLARDGELLRLAAPEGNPRGALACLARLWLHHLSPTDAEVRVLHGPRRTAKVERAFDAATSQLDRRFAPPRPDLPDDRVALATRLVRSLRAQVPPA